MTQPQQLAVGTPGAAQYDGLGGFTGSHRAGLEHTFSFFFGLSGEGKTNLMEQVPDSFRFNLDCSSTIAKAPTSMNWPVLDSTGNLLLAPSQIGSLSWEAAEAKVTILKRLAAENKHRPTTIIFDSLTSWVRLLQDYVARNAVKLSLRSNDRGPAENFRQLDGKAAWDVVYETVVQTCSMLRSSGYGVFLVGHVVKELIPIGEDRMSQELAFTTGPGLWKRMHPLLENSIYIGSVLEPVEETYEQESIVRGERKIDIKKRSVNKKRVYAEGERVGLEGMTKIRVRIPKVLLPETGAWEALSKAYREASEAK